MKKIILSIIAIFAITIIIVGGTYAFLQTSIESNLFNTGSQEFEIIYNGGNNINGIMSVGAKKEDGLSTTVNMKITQNSVKAITDIILNITSMSESLSQTGFKWEVYGYKKDKLVYSNNGNFEGKSAEDKITIVDDYQLSTDETFFDIYVWIDGTIAGNEVIGANFSGFISAQTENFTGALS